MTIVVAAGLIVLAGCGGGKGAMLTATAGSTATAMVVPPTSTPLPASTVGKVVWTASVDPTTNAPGNAVQAFPNDAPVLYAVVYVTNVRAGSVLSASWTYNDVALSGVVTSVVPTALYTGGYVQFHLARAASATWPAGTYKIEIALDGAPIRSATIDVTDS